MNAGQIDEALHRVKQTYGRWDMWELRDELVELRSIREAAKWLPDKRQLSDARILFDEVSGHLHELVEQRKRQLLAKYQGQVQVQERPAPSEAL